MNKNTKKITNYTVLAVLIYSSLFTVSTLSLLSVLAIQLWVLIAIGIITFFVFVYAIYQLFTRVRVSLIKKHIIAIISVLIFYGICSVISLYFLRTVMASQYM